MEKELCYITKKEFDLTKLVQGSTLKSQIISLIQKDYPDFSSDYYISLDILNT